MKRRRMFKSLSAHEDDYVTPPQLAIYLVCDVRTIRRMIAVGSLPAYRVGRDWRIPTDDACAAFRVPRSTFPAQH